MFFWRSLTINLLIDNLVWDIPEEEILVTIDDDDEFDRVADAFDNEMMEEIDLDDTDK